MGSVVERSVDQRVSARDVRVKRYFYGSSSKLYPQWVHIMEVYGVRKAVDMLRQERFLVPKIFSFMHNYLLICLNSR